MDPRLLQHVQSAYRLPEIASHEFVTKGVLSENWFIEAGGIRYFLKKYRFDDESRIREILAAEQFFADRSIPIILPVPTKKGGSFLGIQETYYALFPFVSARQLERGELSDKAIISMGSMLGRIHQAGKDCTLVIQKEGFKIWDEAAFRESVQSYIEKIENIPAPTRFDALAKEDLELKLSLVPEDSRQYAEFELSKDHLIHGDYLDHNLFFNSEDEVSHVFDLEKSQFASRSYEFIRSLLYCIMDPNLGSESICRAKLYMHAYQEIYPIPTDELKKGIEIFFLKSIRGLWMHKELYDLHNRRPEQFLAMDMARTRFLALKRKELVKALVH